MSLRENLITLLEPTVEAMGYELVELDARSNPKSGLIRIYIDKPGGVGLDDCEQVSHQVSGVLDVEDPMPGQYSLEVSSPGLDRPLRTQRHFEQVVGSRIKVELNTPLADRRWRLAGELTGVEDGRITLNVDGEPLELEMASLNRARLVPEL